MPDFDDESGVYSSHAARRNRRRKPAVFAVAGLAAVLGGGAYFVTDAMTGKTHVAPNVALTPLAPPAPAPGESVSGESETPASVSDEPPASSASSTAKGVPAGEVPATPTASVDAEARKDSISAAEGTAAKARDKVRRPLPPVANGAPVKDVKVRNIGSLAADGATLRVVSGRGDLTGQRELALVADDGIAVGDAHCAQKFRFTAGTPGVEKPSMMICWRTSADRSVFTVAVSKTGRPSAAAGAAAISEQWTKLG